MSGELLPCPFCGGQAVIHFGGVPVVKWLDCYKVVCVSCGTYAAGKDDKPNRGYDWSNTPVDAINRWNRRNTIECVALQPATAKGMQAEEPPATV
jgi:transcription elongation factor Elf1